MKKSIFVVGIFVLSMFGCPCFAGYSYSVQEIPSIGAGFVSAASAINDNGDVTGEAESQAYNTLFIYRDGVSTNFGPRSSDVASISNPIIDDNGAVAATISGNQGSKATIYRGSKIQTLPDPGLGAAVLDENGTGTDVGIVGVSGGYSRAAEWNDGKLKVLSDIPGLITQLNAVNSKGEAVGSTMNSSFKSSAFAVIDGKVQYLTAQSYTMSGVNDVNDNGDVVGAGTDPNGKRDSFAIINGKAVPIAPLADSKDLVGGVAINDEDQIVGIASDPTGYSKDHAVLIENGKTIDLNTEINPNLGYDLTDSIDINNRGQILVQGRDHGQFASFVLTPQAIPLPPSVWMGLTTLPLLGFALRRRRCAA